MGSGLTALQNTNNTQNEAGPKLDKEAMQKPRKCSRKRRMHPIFGHNLVVRFRYYMFLVTGLKSLYTFVVARREDQHAATAIPSESSNDHIFSDPVDTHALNMPLLSGKSNAHIRVGRAQRFTPTPLRHFVGLGFLFIVALVGQTLIAHVSLPVPNERFTDHELAVTSGHTQKLAPPNAEDEKEFQDEPATLNTEEVAPRTSLLEYNRVDPDPRARYLIYSPSGGFNNQRGELEYALKMGTVLGRTVAIPQAARHTSMWKAYSRLDRTSLLPMDRVLDFEYLTEYNPQIVPLNTTVDAFVNRVRKQFPRQTIDIEVKRWYFTPLNEKLVKKAQVDTHKFAYFEGNFWQQWYKPTVMDAFVKPYVRYAPYLRQLALSLADQLRGGESGPQVSFSAVHVRRGDYKDKFTSIVPFIRRLKEAGVLPGTFLYVATEPNSRRGFFAPLCKVYNCKYSSDLLTDKGVKRFHNMFLGMHRKMFWDVFGMVEQMICVLADIFQGSEFSTFTQWIEFARSNRQDQLFPEAFAHWMKHKAYDIGTGVPTHSSSEPDTDTDTEMLS